MDGDEDVEMKYRLIAEGDYLFNTVSSQDREHKSAGLNGLPRPLWLSQSSELPRTWTWLSWSL